jgi:hypothetical protein
VRLGAVAVEEGIYGTQLVMRFDVLDEEFAGRCIKAWAAAKLSGGRCPSKLYSWTSALLFGGMPLPERYDPDTDALYKRDALAVVEIIDRDGVYYNRIVQLFPWRPPRASLSPNPHIPAEPDVPAPPWEEGWVDDSDNGRILEDEPPW